VRHRVPDQPLKDCPIHIRKLLNVEAALSCRVSPEFGQEGFCFTVAQHAVQNKRSLTRRTANKRHVSFTAAVISVMIAAEANNGGSPKPRLFPGGPLHKLNQFLRVGASHRIGQGIDVSTDA